MSDSDKKPEPRAAFKFAEGVKIDDMSVTRSRFPGMTALEAGAGSEITGLNYDLNDHSEERPAEKAVWEILNLSGLQPAEMFPLVEQVKMLDAPEPGVKERAFAVAKDLFVRIGTEGVRLTIRDIVLKYTGVDLAA